MRRFCAPRNYPHPQNRGELCDAAQSSIPVQPRQNTKVSAMSTDSHLCPGRTDMLARGEASFSSCPHCKTAILLGRVASWKGRASKLLVAFNQAIQKPAVAGFLFYLCTNSLRDCNECSFMVSLLREKETSMSSKQYNKLQSVTLPLAGALMFFGTIALLLG